MNLKVSSYRDVIPAEVSRVLNEENINQFRPPQATAINCGLFESKDLLIASPTASGKTLIAEMSIIDNIKRKKGRAIYLCPLRSLANEKYEQFRKKYPEIKTAISIGDYDSRDSFLNEYDLIITSNEKLDALLRHGAYWIKNVKSVIIDEVHLINDVHRGPTLEVLTTRLRLLLPDAQFVYLSATIKNSSELASWLEAELVKSDYRPVELQHGTFLNNRLEFYNGGASAMPSGNPESSVLADTLRIGKQCIYFVNSRRNSEALALRLAGTFDISSEEKKELEKIANRIKNSLEIPTMQCEKLSDAVKKGVAFHHAGLVMKQRTIIEDSFKKGVIKAICATPTLAMGVNLPAFRVIIRDLKRYTSFGMDWIPVLEYHQIAGRAGRPAYDDEGQVITFSSTESEKNDIKKRYVDGELEEIYSKLSAENVLRMHVLGLISDVFVRTEEELKTFFKKTFWSFQYSFDSGLEMKIRDVIHDLKSWKFIEFKNERFLATKIGRRVSELYLDPLSASKILEALEKAKESETSEISFVHLISTCAEMWPKLRVYPRNYPELSAELAEYAHKLLVKEPNPFEDEYQEYLQGFRTALMFMDWLDEKSYDDINKKYRVPPGILHNMLLNAEWLLYSTYELAKLSGLKEKLTEIAELRARMKYGIKKELMQLVSIKGVGRARARKLYNKRIKTVSDIKNLDIKVLSTILGKKTAENIIRRINE